MPTILQSAVKSKLIVTNPILGNINVKVVGFKIQLYIRGFEIGPAAKIDHRRHGGRSNFKPIPVNDHRTE